MARLHTFGCSITQGHALPDIVRPVCDPQTGLAYTEQEIETRGIELQWEDIHLYEPSSLAWPSRLGQMLGLTVVNHARRGSCFRQISRQIATELANIHSDDLVIVMWTYFTRLSLQWPARTAVPFCNVADPLGGWQTICLGTNRLFGLSGNPKTTKREDQEIQEFLDWAVTHVYTTPLDTYDRYYNNLVMQTLAAESLAATGARVIHLSVEIEPVLDQLARAQQDLYPSLGSDYSKIPDPRDWYKLDVDYSCTPVILDPRLPLAANDMHPGVEHHQWFAQYLRDRYFRESL